MKKINTYSTQFKIIQPHQNHAGACTASHSNPNPPKTNKKKVTKDRQEFTNNISASGFKQFQVYCAA